MHLYLFSLISFFQFGYVGEAIDRDNAWLWGLVSRSQLMGLKLDDFNYELMANDLYKYLYEKNIKKTSILGHSMGGKT